MRWGSAVGVSNAHEADKQGLEGYQLVEKMGDGAFSNVYKAVDKLTGKKVAVKVVRKYELNSSQVCTSSSSSSIPIAVPIAGLWFFLVVIVSQSWPDWELGQWRPSLLFSPYSVNLPPAKLTMGRTATATSTPTSRSAPE
jgi:serine/threonine protein kinase